MSSCQPIMMMITISALMIVVSTAIIDRKLEESDNETNQIEIHNTTECSKYFYFTLLLEFSLFYTIIQKNIQLKKHAILCDANGSTIRSHAIRPVRLVFG